MVGRSRRRLLLVGLVLSLALVAAAFQIALSAETAAQPAPPQAGALIVQADFVQGVTNLPGPQMPLKACVVTSRFPRNSELVFRARVWDPQTGQALEGQGVSSLQIGLADGTTLDMNYGPHPPQGEPTDAYWTAAWMVPKDYPTGTLDFSITATAPDGRTGQYVPFNLAPSLLAITSEVLPDLPPPATPVPQSTP
ncbi:MAG: hypothetical protein HY690_02775 [Chloroflexi bacterium]|nr:hypothetical protein [Chloroflexota bacterium]